MSRDVAFSVLLAVVTSATGCSHGNPPVEGKWAIASARLGGSDLPAATFQGSLLELTAGRYTFQNDTGTFTVNPAVTPMTLDVHGMHGPNAGRTIPAIVGVKGDTMTICYDLSGAGRPTAFRSDSGTQLFLVRYIRQGS